MMQPPKEKDFRILSGVLTAVQKSHSPFGLVHPLTSTMQELAHNIISSGGLNNIIAYNSI